jgi:hypothetical protein
MHRRLTNPVPTSPSQSASCPLCIMMSHQAPAKFATQARNLRCLLDRRRAHQAAAQRTRPEWASNVHRTVPSEPAHSTIHFRVLPNHRQALSVPLSYPFGQVRIRWFCDLRSNCEGPQASGGMCLFGYSAYMKLKIDGFSRSELIWTENTEKPRSKLENGLLQWCRLRTGR